MFVVLALLTNNWAMRCKLLIGYLTYELLLYSFQ